MTVVDELSRGSIQFVEPSPPSGNPECSLRVFSDAHNIHMAQAIGVVRVVHVPAKRAVGGIDLIQT